MRKAVARLLATLVGFAFAVPGWGEGPPTEPKPPHARVDLYGDSLPEGAIARLGSVRFRHRGAVRAVAFSEDGELLAASSDGQNMVVIWERKTGRKLREISLGEDGHPPDQLRFSRDGKRLCGSTWWGFRAWNVDTGAEPKDLPRPPAKSWLLGYSPDAAEAIFLNEKVELVRWDVDKGKELGRYRYPNPKREGSAVARIGDRLLVPHYDGQSLAMWDAVQAKRLWSIEFTPARGPPAMPTAFSGDSSLLAVLASSPTISVYESVTGKLVQRLKADVREAYYSVSISPDKRTVAASNRDGSLRLWDLETGKERAKISAIEGWTTHVFFAPDSKTVATGGGNNAHGVVLWDAATGKRIDSFLGHRSPVSSVAFAPKGGIVATSSWLRGDPVVRVWDRDTGRLLRSLDTGSSDGVFALTYSPDGTMLAACGRYGDSGVRIWDARTWRLRHTLVGHEAGCTCVAFSPNGERLVSGDSYYRRESGQGGRLCIWDTESGERVREIRGTPGAIFHVAFSGDGRHIVAAADEHVHIYDADTGQRVWGPIQAGLRVSMALSPDGRLLATADGRGAPWLWELATRRAIPVNYQDDKCWGVDFGPDGRTLALLRSKGGTILFDWPSGTAVKRLAGDSDSWGVFFAPDGRRLATTCHADSSALIWDVAALVHRPVRAVGKPTDEDLRGWWQELRDPNSSDAYRAVWRFAAVPDQALPFLAASLRPVKAPEPDTVARLIADLDSAEFEVREKASRELEQFGEAVVDTLERAMKGKISAEQARRIKELLAKHAESPGPEQLRAAPSARTAAARGCSTTSWPARSAASRLWLSDTGGDARMARISP
jgi:WD40 repeat protein